MRKTNILIEVEDSVYERVIAPHKKAKTFSKLAATLLKGYIENEYIRSYVEGTLDNMHKASVEVLDEVLDGMTQSLAEIGLYTSELKNSAEKGINAFSSVEGGFNGSSAPKSEIQELRDNVQTLKQLLEKQQEEIEEQRKDIKTQNARILELLENSSKVEVSNVTSSPKIQKSEVRSPKLENHIVSKPVSNTPVLEMETPSLVLAGGDNSDVGISTASDSMSSLLAGNSHEF